MATFKNLSGQKFGKLTVLDKYERRTKPSGQTYIVWHCKCDCGNKCVVSASNLNRGHSTSCGCNLTEILKTREHPKGPSMIKLRNDLTGKIFGHLTVICRIDNRITPKGHSLVQYKCKCDCGNECNITANVLRNSSPNISCGCAQAENLIGQRFGRLTVIHRVESGTSTKWHCKCDCGNECDVFANSLKRGSSKSCGCLNIELAKQRALDKKSLNRYDLTSKPYGIGYCNRTTEELPFLFDLEDYDLIKNYEWTKDENGYIVTYDYTEENIPTYMHHIVLSKPANMYITHIHGTESNNDNRKANLRICDRAQYIWNYPIRVTNTSGVTGVYYSKSKKCWVADLKHYGIRERKSFKTKEEAIEQRKAWEEEFYGEYSYDNSRAIKLD